MPQLIADLFCSRYKSIVIFSAVIGIICGLAGLFVSYYINVPAGACIVFALVVFYGLARAIARIKQPYMVE